MKNTLFAIFFLLTAQLSGVIIETKNIFDIETHKDEDTLIIYDIDNTLIEPQQTLGSDQWFSHHFFELKKHLKNEEAALEKALSHWLAIQTLSTMKEVQEGTAQLIKKQQNENSLVMGLTTRNYAFSNCTFDQLRSLGIDLSKTAPNKKDHYFKKERMVAALKGILFTSGTHKGDALFAYLDKIKYYPKKIVFINDKKSHLIPVEESCNERNIPFVGLRYGYVDEKVENYNKHVAAIQIQHFGNLLSDDEALALLETSILK